MPDLTDPTLAPDIIPPRVAFTTPGVKAKVTNAPVCAGGTEPVDCACDAGADGRIRYCGPNAANRRCTMTVYCFHGAACDDTVVTGSCQPL